MLLRGVFHHDSLDQLMLVDTTKIQFVGESYSEMLISSPLNAAQF